MPGKHMPHCTTSCCSSARCSGDKSPSGASASTVRTSRSVASSGRHQARRDRLAIQQNQAGAAETFAADRFGAGQEKLVAEHVHEWTKGSLVDTRSSPLIFNRIDIACSSGLCRSRLFAQRACGFAHEIGKNFHAIPSRRLDTVARAQSCAMVLRFFGRTRGVEQVADQFGFQFAPAPCRRLDRSDGSAGARDHAGCIQRYSKAENGNRIVAGFPQRQPHMHGTPRHARNDDALHELTRREACAKISRKRLSGIRSAPRGPCNSISASRHRSAGTRSAAAKFAAQRFPPIVATCRMAGFAALPAAKASARQSGAETSSRASSVCVTHAPMLTSLAPTDSSRNVAIFEIAT